MKTYIVHKLLYQVYLFFTDRSGPDHYVFIAKHLLWVHWGAAADISPGQQCPQQQEADHEWQAAGLSAYGGWTGGVHRLELAAAAWAQDVSLLLVGLCWSGWHFMGALSSLALTHKLLCSRSCGAARRVRGAEARAGWWAGRTSAHAANLVFWECYMTNQSVQDPNRRICVLRKNISILSHKLATHLAGI